jgi:two-component system CheB/CheR fusion protein
MKAKKSKLKIIPPWPFTARDIGISQTEQAKATNAELKSANEELLGGNEKMQFLIEELETSKEELLTTNEALISLNDIVSEAQQYAESIVATIREPLLVLDKHLRVKTANNAFYKTFHVNKEDTENVLVYDLGAKQWNIPALRTLLEEILPQRTDFTDFEVRQTFIGIGEKILLLNARRIVQKNPGEELILLALHDVTEIRTRTLELQNKEKELLDKHIRERKAEKLRLEKLVSERTKELEQANKELVLQNHEKEQRAAELIIANKELAFQNTEKEKRAAELVIANKELAFQNTVKETLAEELIIANIELAFQNKEKEKRAAELVIANKELAFQGIEKEKRAAELTILNTALGLHNEAKEKQTAELIIANKELLAFAYISSHDLQEPLRKIQTFTGHLLQKEYAVLSDTGKKYFDKIHHAASRMRTLIEDLLAYSRTSITERIFEKDGLLGIIEEVRNDLSESILEKKATIQTGKLDGAFINHSQFRQVMNNLVANALKFSKPGIPPRITITSKLALGNLFQKEFPSIQTNALLPEKSYCHISFADNGIGFDPLYKDRIFEVFQRLHGKEEYAGTGIGLAIVKKIIENHNGTITANGQLNKGATFDIYIPAA